MRSLYVRVVAMTLYSIAISGFLGYYAATAHYHWTQKPALDEKLFLVAERIRDHVARYPESMGDYLREAAALGYRLQLYDETGNGMAFGGAFLRDGLSDDIKRSVLAGNDYHGIADYPNKPFETGYFDDSLSNTVGISLSVQGEGYALFLRHDSSVQFDELRMFFLVMFAMSVLFSIPYFMFSARYMVQPIVRLTEATKQVADGRYNIKVEMKRKDEIGQLAGHFQQMSRALERSDRTKKEFVANVSHEIQSPLASIQGYADSLLREDVDVAHIRHYASIIGQETRHLAALGRQLLLLSTLEHDTYTPEKLPILLQPQLRKALQHLEWQLEEKEIAVRMLVPSGLIVCGDEVLFMQVWSNLLSNAVKHIPEGRSIEVQAAVEDGCCVVMVRDTGDGIPENQLPYIYDRFYRGDSARDRRTGSTGLGLSIVQKIVHLHGGTIEADSLEGAGTTFTVRLPVE